MKQVVVVTLRGDLKMKKRQQKKRTTRALAKREKKLSLSLSLFSFSSTLHKRAMKNLNDANLGKYKTKGKRQSFSFYTK